MRERRLIGLVGAIAFSVAFGSSAADGNARPEYRSRGPTGLELDRRQPQAYASAAGNDVGAERFWLGRDAFVVDPYFKNYALKAKRSNVEVWVAHGVDFTSANLNFPTGDCRNGRRSRVGTKAAEYLARQFNRKIYPRESNVFSVPPSRNGRHSFATTYGLPSNYYSGGRRGADNVVILVDNIRDESFYDLDNSRNGPYIEGFFSSVFNEAFDRNVITIDGFDWLHRTHANPPDDSVPGDNCQHAPARPFFYEGVLAREYQHLLHFYEDPNEQTWIDQGLSEWARTLTEYATPSRSITERGFDPGVQCFLGHLRKRTRANPDPGEGGPENSLTAWGDQGPDEMLCDSGAAYTMMTYLRGQFGRRFLSALHSTEGNGLKGLQDSLDEMAPGASAASVLHRWAAAVALDGVLSDGAALRGGRARLFETPALDATINWRGSDGFSSPGAPPNGSDYVRLRDEKGDFLTARDIDSISFDGAEQLEAGAPDSSPTRIGAEEVENFNVQLIAYSKRGAAAWRATLPLNAVFEGEVAGDALDDLIGRSASVVSAIVTQDDSTETVSGYATYTLRVNGVMQPGGAPGS